MTYRTLESQIEYTIKILRKNEVNRNDRVAIILPNGPEIAVAFLGVASGSTCAPMNPQLRSEELTFFLSDMKARALARTRSQIQTSFLGTLNARAT